jgi:hypothetical protein
MSITDEHKAIDQIEATTRHIAARMCGQHIAGRLVRLANVERMVRMRAQWSTIDDDGIIQPCGW